MSRSSGSPRIPKYRLHRPSGLAVARFNGVDYYLGKYGSQESRDEYDRFLNKRVGRTVRMFKWGVESEFVAPVVNKIYRRRQQQYKRGKQKGDIVLY